MRISLPLLLAALVSTTALHAIPTSEGRIIKGKYTANGSAGVAGVTITYLPGTARVTSHGKIRGSVIRQVSSNGVLLQSSYAQIRGTAKRVKIRSKKGNFASDAVVRVSGAVFRGSFSGLTDQRLSRYFRGKINGQQNSRFTMRSR